MNSSEPMPNGGAGGSGSGGIPFAETAEWIGMTCGVTNCHANRYPPSLSSADLDVLRYTLVTYAVERCGDLPLVDPGNVEGSALPMVVRGECQNLLMPFGCVTPPEFPCVDEPRLAALEAWIENPEGF